MKCVTPTIGWECINFHIFLCSGEYVNEHTFKSKVIHQSGNLYSRPIITPSDGTSCRQTVVRIVKPLHISFKHFFLSRKHAANWSNCHQLCFNSICFKFCIIHESIVHQTVVQNFVKLFDLFTFQCVSNVRRDSSALIGLRVAMPRGRPRKTKQSPDGAVHGEIRGEPKPLTLDEVETNGQIPLGKSKPRGRPRQPRPQVLPPDIKSEVENMQHDETEEYAEEGPKVCRNFLRGHP